MAMSVSKTASKSGVHPAHAGWQKVVIDWTTDSNGVASDTINLVGQVQEVVTIPGSGADMPTGQYDLTLRDPSNANVDYLNGACMNRSSDTVEFAEPLVSSTTPCCVVGDVVFHVENAGDSKSGRAVFILRN